MEAPVPAKVPPQLPVYHFQAAAGLVPRLPPETLSVAVPPAQIAAGVAQVGVVEGV